MAKRKVLFIHHGLGEDFKIPLGSFPFDCSCSILSDNDEILKNIKKNHYKLILCGLKTFKALPDTIKSNPKFIVVPKIFYTVDNNVISSEKESLKLGAVDYISYPFDPDLLKRKISMALNLESYRNGVESILKEQFKKIEQLNSGIIMMLANIIESRDGTTGEHVKRVSYYVKALAMKLKESGVYEKELSNTLIEKLIDAAALHDIGKITVPDSILKKTGKLSEEEFEMMKNHSKEGGLIIKNNLKFLQEADFVKVAADIASYHHENWDGTGYPFGKKETDIPLVARITAVADVFDALVSKRLYKEAMSVDDALALMAQDEGTKFEPVILKVFLSMGDELKKLIKELS